MPRTAKDGLHVSYGASVRFGLEDGQKEATPRGFGKSRRAEHGR